MDQRKKNMKECIDHHDAGAMAATGCEGGKTARKLTDARREQNRQAQRVFRQRQKELKARAKEDQAALRAGPASQPPRKLAPRPHPRLEGHLEHISRSARELGSDSAASSGGEAQSTPNVAAIQLTSTTSFSSSVSDTRSSNTDNETRMISTKSSTVSRSRHASTATARSELNGLADPYASGPQLMQSTLLQAIFRNAICLGFDLARLAVCSPDYISPFWQPELDIHTNPQSLTTAPGTTHLLPPNLRPTFAQILVPHHASLDLIPIPILRDRAIFLSVTRPDSCDLYDLKMDIYHNGGLMVWGSADQRGDNGMDEAWERDSMDGWEWVPWNRRCWEAAPWFLSKWSMAVDGDEGELGKQSRWWKTVRDAREAQGCQVMVGN